MTDEQKVAEIVKRIPDVLRHHSDGMKWLDLARALGCTYTTEHMTRECQLAIQDAADEGIIVWNTKLQPIPGPKMKVDT